jgi:hypothetical protein
MPGLFVAQLFGNALYEEIRSGQCCSTSRY